MQQDKYLKLYGLSRRHGETLRALFDSAQAATDLPSWVQSRANHGALVGLVRAGLVSENVRLTLAGLAVAASLPALRRCRWLEAA